MHYALVFKFYLRLCLVAILLLPSVMQSNQIIKVNHLQMYFGHNDKASSLKINIKHFKQTNANVNQIFDDCIQDIISAQAQEFEALVICGIRICHC